MAESFDPRVYARQMAAEYGVDPDIFTKMLFAESSFDPNAKSVVRGKDYVGYGQLGAAAAQDVGITDRFDPRQNIEGSAKYLKMQLDEFGSYPLALAAYNAGPQTVRDKGGIPNYPETQAYIEKIMGNNTMNPNQKTIVSQTGISSSEPVNAPIDIVPEYMRERTPVTPALLRRIREEEAAKAASQAAAPDPNDPYANLSKTQRRMLSFAAIKDAGMALQGLEGKSVQNLLSDFTTRADQARKAQAAQARQQMMQQMFGGDAMSGIGAITEGADPIETLRDRQKKIAALAAYNPSLAPALKLEMDRIENDIIRLTQQQTASVSQESAINALNSLLNSPNLSKITEYRGTFNEFMNQYGMAPEYATLMGYVDQVKGLNFLEAYQQLKGGGPITDIEGKQATAARSRLDAALKGTPEDLRIALLDVRDLFLEAQSKNPMFKKNQDLSDEELEYLKEPKE